MDIPNLKTRDLVVLGTLALLAAFIWLRNMDWMSTSDDTLPILISLPVFIWLGWPWKLMAEDQPLPTWGIITGLVIFLAGIVSNLTVLLALGWCVWFWSFIKSRVATEQHDMAKKLMILPLIAFPWITLDAEVIGWWFRLSGAWTTGNLFSMAGYHVVQEGTFIHINGAPISVEPACSGLNTLQSMLIAGSMMAFVLQGESNRYWFCLPFLIIMAWVANTTRIVMLTLASILVSPEFAMGTFHDWGGWLILVLMFLLCWLAFSFQSPSNNLEGQTPS